MTVRTRLQDSFLSGLLLVLPLVFTVVLFRVVFRWTIGFVDPVVAVLGLERVFANERLVAQAATAGLMFAVVTLLGFVAESSVGDRALGRIGGVIRFVPVFRTVYAGVRQVAGSFTDRSDQYESVVFVRSPWEDIYSIGFVTGDSPADLAAHTGEPVFNVYQPGAPNPTAGRLLLVPESRMVEADISVRQAVRLLMTTGVAATSEEMERAAGPDEVPLDLSQGGR